jgi:hypothetical protein
MTIIELLIFVAWYVWMATFTWKELYYTSGVIQNSINYLIPSVFWPIWVILEIVLGWIGFITNKRSFFIV